MKKDRTFWAYLYMPILFLVFGYLSIFVVFAPVIQFVTSSIDLILLNEAPTFKEEKSNIFDESTQTKKEFENKKSIPSSKIKYPTVGTEYGKLIIDKIKVNSALTFGDRPEDLRTGVGQFDGSVFPGEPGTSLIGGHNTTDLGTMNLLEEGDSVTVTTNYGTYKYNVTDKFITRFDDPKAIENLYKHEGHHLILYTCYPVDMIGLTDDRLFVYADLSSGPLIDLTQ